MNETTDNIATLKQKIEALEAALEKQVRSKKTLKSLFSSKNPLLNSSDISISLLSKLIDSSVDGIIAADKKGRLLIFNRAAGVILGYTVEEALEMLNIRDIYPENGAYEVMAKIRSEGYGGVGNLTGYLGYLVDKKGDNLPVRINASIVYEKEREIATIGYLRDLRDKSLGDSELERLATAVEPSNRDMSLHDFLSSMNRQLQMYDRKFCFGAVENKLVTIQNVKQALLTQREIVERTKVYVPIGRIMIQSGFLTEEQRDTILNFYSMDFRENGSENDCMETADPRTAADDAKRKEDPPPLDTVQLQLSENNLEAAIDVGVENRRDMETGDILKRLEREGITYGVIEPADIEEYLNTEDAAPKRLVIARGTPPVPDKPPETRLNFSLDPLGVGTCREDGTIDWKNRGNLPQANTGDVLAEVIPGEEGSSGTDVFGNDIAPPGVKPSLAKCGKGVEMSEDGTQYIAKLDGMVSLSDDNKIHMAESRTIDGDVGLDTGHIDFDGHLEVSGSVQKGYRVSCKSLRARDIQGAEIVVGEMVVMGGIYDAVVKCRNGLKASHVHKSEVQAGGDILVEKEIMESEIESGGKCIIPEGAIIYSEIKAKKGVIAKHIGTLKSKPSVLILGMDQRSDRQTLYAKKKLELQKKELADLPEEIEMARKQMERFETDTQGLLDEQSEIDNRLEAARQKIEKLDARRQKKALSKLKSKIDALTDKREQRAEQLKQIKEQMERASVRIARKEEDLMTGQETLEQLTMELDQLTAKKPRDPIRASVQVSGNIYSGTIVTGPNAMLTVKDDLSNVSIQEEMCTHEDGTESWEMQLQGM